MIALLMAQAAVGAAFTPPKASYSSSNVIDLLGERIEGIGSKSVRVRLTIDDTGAIADCVVELSSGKPSIDRRTCGFARRFFRYAPARDRDGTALWSVDRRTINLSDGGSIAPQTIDVFLRISKLPERSGRDRREPSINTFRLVNADGREEGCVAAGGEYPVFARFACEAQVPGLTPAKDAAGAPRRSVVSIRVGFRPAASGAATR